MGSEVPWHECTVETIVREAGEECSLREKGRFQVELCQMVYPYLKFEQSRVLCRQMVGAMRQGCKLRSGRNRARELGWVLGTIDRHPADTVVYGSAFDWIASFRTGWAWVAAAEAIAHDPVPQLLHWLDAMPVYGLSEAQQLRESVALDKIAWLARDVLCWHRIPTEDEVEIEEHLAGLKEPIQIALSMFEANDFRYMGVLADALEDAGLSVPWLLSHARSGQPHFRGCPLIRVLTGEH